MEKSNKVIFYKSLTRQILIFFVAIAFVTFGAVMLPLNKMTIEYFVVLSLWSILVTFWAKEVLKINQIAPCPHCETNLYFLFEHMLGFKEVSFCPFCGGSITK